VKAIVITAPGGPEVLAVRELPDPVPAEGEILVRVRAFGLNHEIGRASCRERV